MTPTLTRGQSWMLVLAATFTMTISYVDRQALAVLAPTITRELHISETRYGLMMSMFSLAYLVGAPFAGRWIDRVGARRGLLAAVPVPDPDIQPGRLGATLAGEIGRAHV